MYRSRKSGQWATMTAGCSCPFSITGTGRSIAQYNTEHNVSVQDDRTFTAQYSDDEILTLSRLNVHSGLASHQQKNHSEINEVLRHNRDLARNTSKCTTFQEIPLITEGLSWGLSLLLLLYSIVYYHQISTCFVTAYSCIAAKASTHLSLQRHNNSRTNVDVGTERKLHFRITEIM